MYAHKNSEAKKQQCAIEIDLTTSATGNRMQKDTYE